MIIDYNKYSDGLVPAIIQDYRTNVVLMLGFMNEEAVVKTTQLGKVTFFSRNKKRLWTKGEVSGNFLSVKDMKVDCDNDTLLIKAEPVGPVCHTGADTCWMRIIRTRPIISCYIWKTLSRTANRQLPANRMWPA